MRRRVAIAAVLAALVLWGIVATVLWATGDTGPAIVTTVTVEQP